MGINTVDVVNVGGFTSGQKTFLEFHRMLFCFKPSVGSETNLVTPYAHPGQGVGTSLKAHAALPRKKAPHRGGAFTSSKTGLPDQERESSDSPRLKAFCRVAPSVRFRVRAMLAARVFFLASVFNVRTSSDFHARRLEFLAISLPPGWKNTPCFCSLMLLERKHLNMAGSRLWKSGFVTSGSIAG